MFLSLSHSKLDIYQVVQELILECYNQVKKLPDDESYNLGQQIKRAAISVKLNLAEGASRKSMLERKRFYEVARGSVIEIDAAMDICVRLGYLNSEHVKNIGPLLIRGYSMLSKMVGKSEK
jgi:four helix bundle protein